MKASVRILLAVGFVVAALPARSAEIKLNGHTFTLPDGFTIERVASPGVADRPIVADFDQQGRLFVADSSGSSDKVQIQLAQKPHRIVRLDPMTGFPRVESVNKE